jgi:photosystem II stability/assembly factor-like uncharacterized protein
MSLSRCSQAVGKLQTRISSTDMRPCAFLILALLLHGLVATRDVGWSLDAQTQSNFRRALELPKPSVSPTVFALDSQHVWVASEAVLLSSADAWRTWKASSLPDCAGAAIATARVRFVDSLRGVLFAHNCLMKTVDGGGHWTSVPLPAAYPDGTDAVLIDSDSMTGLAGGGLCTGLVPGVAPPHNAWCDQAGKRYLAATVFRTEDQGDHWQAQRLPYHAAFRVTSLHRVSASLVFALAQNALFRSDDAGKSWRREELRSACTSLEFPGEFDNRPVDLSFVNDHVGWVSYSGGDLLRTTDAGLTWCSIRNPVITWAGATTQENYFAQIRFVSDRQGWGLGADGSVQSTEDGGRTWTRSELGRMSDLSIAPDGSIWVVGSGGVYTWRKAGKMGQPELRD